jgi:membrane-associated phospholipid phosphatase
MRCELTLSRRSRTADSERRFVGRSAVARVAVILAAALAQPAAFAQTTPETDPSAVAGPTPAQPTRLPDDLKAFAAQPLHWRGREWLRFGGVVAAVGLAYQYDNKVRAHYANDGEPNYHEVIDSMPAAAVFGGTWFAAKLAHNEEARNEVAAMRRAIVIETISVEVLKVAFRRERPGPGVSRDGWGEGGLSFPSGHTAAAFAVGTVLAESGNDRQRWWRRIIGYGIGVGTGYQRIHHDAHWLSDTVAGAAVGIWAANFVMKRRESAALRGQVSLTPLDGGAMLTYTVPIH